MICRYCNNQTDETRSGICAYCHAPLGQGQYAPPDGFAYDPTSGSYYKSGKFSDPTTGQAMINILWFNPTDGSYHPQDYPDTSFQPAPVYTPSPIPVAVVAPVQDDTPFEDVEDEEDEWMPTPVSLVEQYDSAPHSVPVIEEAPPSKKLPPLPDFAPQTPPPTVAPVSSVPPYTPEPPAQATATIKQAPRSKKKTLALAAAVVLLCVGGFGIYSFMSGSGDNAGPATEADAPSQTQSKPSEGSLFSGGSGSGSAPMILEREEGMGSFTPPGGSETELEVGTEIPMGSAVDFRGDNVGLVNIDGVNRVSIFDDKLSISMHDGIASVGDSHYAKYFVGNPTENKPFEIIMIDKIIKSDGGWVSVEGVSPSSIKVYAGSADVYSLEGEHLGTLDEGYSHYYSEGKIQENMRSEIEVKFKPDGGLSLRAGIPEYLAEEDFVKPYIDKKREEWNSQQQ